MNNRKSPSNESEEEIQEKIRKLYEEWDSCDKQNNDIEAAEEDGGLDTASIYEGKIGYLSFVSELFSKISCIQNISKFESGKNRLPVGVHVTRYEIVYL